MTITGQSYRYHRALSNHCHLHHTNITMAYNRDHFFSDDDDDDDETGNDGTTTTTTKKKAKAWGKAGKALLTTLITEGEVDIRKNDNNHIDSVREKWFSDRTEKNFRRNYHTFRSEWNREAAVRGGRRRAAEEGKVIGVIRLI